MHKCGIFYDIDLVFPASEVDMPEDKFQIEAKELSLELLIEMRKLIDISKASGFASIFNRCEEVITYSAKPYIDVAMFKLEDEKYNIDITAHLCRKFECRGVLRPASIILELGFYGYNEKNAFRELYTNYRRIIELLIKRAGIPIKVENVVCDYKGNKTLLQIDSYFEKNWSADTTSTFSLAAEFTQGSSYESLVKTFLSMLIIFDSAHHYLSERKSQDRILSHYFKLMHDV